MLGAGNDLWRASLAGVGSEVGIEIQLWQGRLASGENVGRQGVVVEAVEELRVSDYHCKKLTKADLQVRNINCRSDRARQMVG